MLQKISYEELAKNYVKDMVLFNNIAVADEFWHNGLIVSPLLAEKIESDNLEHLAKDKSERGGDPITIFDYAEDIYQTYVISDMAALQLYNHTSELISYSEKLDLFFWHITHFGTSWSGVHTTIETEPKDEDSIYTVSELANQTQF